MNTFLSTLLLYQYSHSEGRGAGLRAATSIPTTSMLVLLESREEYHDYDDYYHGKIMAEGEHGTL